MENSFTVLVTDIQKNEFVSAMRWMYRLRDLCVLTIAPLAFFIFILSLNGFSVSAILLPVLLLAVMAVYFEITRANGYKQCPKDIKMIYEFNEQGWTLKVGDDTGSSAWADMFKLLNRRRVFLLCQTKGTSNLLPKRCLTEEQMQQIQTWYKAAKAKK